MVYGKQPVLDIGKTPGIHLYIFRNQDLIGKVYISIGGKNMERLLFLLIFSRWILVISGFICFMISFQMYITYRERKRILNTWKHTISKVVEIQTKRNEYDKKGQKVGRKEYTIIKNISLSFQIGASNKNIEIERKFQQQQKATLIDNYDFEVGQEIPIYFNPKNPQKFKFLGEIPSEKKLSTIIIFFVIAIVLWIAWIAALANS
jgi:hypothetical protein